MHKKFLWIYRRLAVVCVGVGLSLQVIPCHGTLLEELVQINNTYAKKIRAPHSLTKYENKSGNLDYTCSKCSGSWSGLSDDASSLEATINSYNCTAAYNEAVQASLENKLKSASPSFIAALKAAQMAAFVSVDWLNSFPTVKDWTNNYKQLYTSIAR